MMPLRFAMSNFNPRSPYGERRELAAFNADLQKISIHAPRTGSDATSRSVFSLSAEFQSTLPVRGATMVDFARGDKSLFQSTLPVRGATRGANLLLLKIIYFNPRSPYGERPGCGRAVTKPVLISIHAPRTGSDLHADNLGGVDGISIHAPRTGSDNSLAKLEYVYASFQSTLPVRGATSGPLGAAAATNISIHAPRTGSDALKPPPPAPPLPFQSTLPVRGATKIFLSRHTPRGISIHAPRTGSDRIESNAIQPAKRISIHAPRTGSDG